MNNVIKTKFAKETILGKISAAYESIGYSPRGNQTEIVYSVIDAFFNKDKKTVVLGAPTGIGKSVLGLVISEVVNSLYDEEKSLSSVISMGTNALSKQYAESFEKLGKYRVFQIKGASNYSCAYMALQPNSTGITAEECVKSKLLPVESDRYCRGCEFDAAKKTVNATDNLITNYAYFFTSQLTSGHLKPRKLHVFDEAHILNDIFCTFTEIVVSCDLLDKYIKELSGTNGKCDNEAAGLIMLKQKLSDGGIGEENYKSILEVLCQIYKSCVNILDNQSKQLEGHDIVASAKYSKMASKYKRLAVRITDLFEKEYDHVFDNSVANTFTVKTIFIGELMQDLLAEYNLLMSATITEQFCFDTLQLDRDTTEFIQAEPVFPPENKPIFFIGKTALNYNSLKEKDTIDTLKAQVSKIVAFHKDQKGLLLAPSFYLGSSLVWGLKGTKVFEHKSGVNLPDLIAQFKSYKGAALLVSPSIFEGLDFSGDDSRFQILCKTPYQSLGDKRVKYIADHYPNIYREDALIKIIQGAGRGVRTPEDFAATYCLDLSSKKLFDAKTNIWKNQFRVMS